MPRWDKAQVVTENGKSYHCPLAVARSLLEAGLATFLHSKPVTISVIPVERIWSAFIPVSCKNFIEEYVAQSGYRVATNHRSRKPRGSVEKKPLVEDFYVPMPLGS